MMMIFSSSKTTDFPFFRKVASSAARPALRTCQCRRPPPGFFQGESPPPPSALCRRWGVRVRGSVQGLGVGDGHGVQHLVQQLQGPVQVDLDPARRLLDALPGVVGPPALHEAHPQDAQAPQVVHADARGRRQTCGREGQTER